MNFLNLNWFSRFAQSTVSSLGGRSFDLDVDIEDPCCYEILSEINRSVEEERAVETTFKEVSVVFLVWYLDV